MIDTQDWPIPENRFRHWLDVSTDWRRPGVAESYRLYWSDAAKFGQVLPRPSADAIAPFYEVEDYYTHTPDAAAKSAKDGGVALRALMAIAWRLDRGKEPTVDWWNDLVPEGARSCLEIGCGDGGNLEILRGRVQTVVGVEPDPAARAVAVRRGLRVFDGVAESLPAEVAGERFDLVVMTHVLEHCRDPIAALENARGVLTERGVLMVETPNNAALGCALRGAGWYWLDAPRHLNFFTEESLHAACAHVGLACKRTEYWGFCRQFSAGWIEAETLIEARLAGRSDFKEADFRRNLRKQIALLLRAGLAPARRKYDSVRVICGKG